MRRHILILLAIVAAIPATICAKKVKSDRIKPQWITRGVPESKSPSYYFISAEGMGASLEAARQMALVNLSSRLEHERGLVIESTTTGGSVQHREGNTSTYTSHREFSMTAKESGKQISMRCRVIDEYWEQNGGQYNCHVLYTVADQNQQGQGSYDDKITLTTSYGARGLVRSIIPGWGQIYKGSTAKGACILAGEAACVVGIILCESERADYRKKSKEQPKFFKEYNTKSNNYEIGRNVCIGAAAALYVYNLIDAVASKGARRVIVKKQRYNFALHPVVGLGEAGVSMALNF